MYYTSIWFPAVMDVTHSSFRLPLWMIGILFCRKSSVDQSIAGSAVPLTHHTPSSTAGECLTSGRFRQSDHQNISLNLKDCARQASQFQHLLLELDILKYTLRKVDKPDGPNGLQPS